MNNIKKQAMFDKMREFVAEARKHDIRFKTFNIATEDSSKHQGRIVVAYGKPFRSGSFELMPVGMAFCSPKDEFTRLQGRGLAAVRLMKAHRPNLVIHIPGQKIGDTLRLGVWAVAKDLEINWMRGKQPSDLR